MYRLVCLMVAVLAAFACMAGCVVETVNREPMRYRFDDPGPIVEKYRSQAKQARQRPDDPAAHWFLGNYYLYIVETHDIEKAVREFQILTRMLPKRPEGYYGLGMCAEAVDDLDAAVTMYEKALYHDDSYADAYRALSRVYRKKGNLMRAREFREKYEGVKDALDYLNSTPQVPKHLLLKKQDRP